MKPGKVKKVRLKRHYYELDIRDRYCVITKIQKWFIKVEYYTKWYLPTK